MSHGRSASVLAVALAGILLGPGTHWPAPAAEPSARLAEQLAAGEFAPALATAETEADPAQRDKLLQRIAIAQAGSGSQEAAWRTLSAMSSDLARSATIDVTRAANGPSGRAGGAEADFDSLIDLITSTVRPQTWDEVGGAGSISPFQNGVYVDPAGVLHRRVREPEARGLAVARLAALDHRASGAPFGRSPLRKISLTRLEKHVQLALAAGRPIDDEMRYLAGLEKIRYLLVYPETGDLVLAGPAGPWQFDAEGRARGTHSGRPVLQLDDLVVLVRQQATSRDGAFACSIEPAREGLARAQQFAASTRDTPLRPGQRDAWLSKLRDSLGRQAIVIEGIDASSRVARVMVEADYHMKLIGMGIEPGTVNVPSYLDLVASQASGAPLALDVLRWWFAMDYRAVHATAEHDAFELRGSGVRLLSENELLDQLGQRHTTGKTQASNDEFAQRFTRHFAALAAKYPLYADLENVFDLALVAALLRHYDLAERVSWHQTCFGPAGAYRPARWRVAESVDTVINHRRAAGKQLIVGVSGGVRAEPARFARPDAIKRETQGRLGTQRLSWASGELPLEAWWWD